MKIRVESKKSRIRIAFRKCTKIKISIVALFVVKFEMTQNMTNTTFFHSHYIDTMKRLQSLSWH